MDTAGGPGGRPTRPSWSARRSSSGFPRTAGPTRSARPSNGTRTARQASFR